MEGYVNRLMEFRQLGRSIARMTVPVLIEQFFIVIMGVVNTMLASNMGPQAISAIGMVDTINIVVISVFSAMSVGGTVVVAQYTGRGDRERANQAAAQALTSCLLISGLATLALFFSRSWLVQTLFSDAEPQVIANGLDYLGIVLWSYIPLALTSIGFGILRGAGDTRTPMTVSILMNLFNVVFSYVLIYGFSISLGFLHIVFPSFGVRGAATGLLMARTAGMLLIMVPILRGSKDIQLTRLSHFRIQMRMQKMIFQLGVPAGTEQLLFNGGKLIVQMFIVSLGTASMAANTISNSVNSLTMIPGNAMAIAATAIVGQQMGRSKPQEARRQLKFLVLVSSAAMLLLSLSLFPLLNLVVGLYTRDPETASLAHFVLTTSLIAQPLLWSTSFILPSGLRGAGDVRYTMIISIVSMWLLRIGIGYLFAIVFAWGVVGIWLAMYADWAVRSIFFYIRMLGRRWLQKSVID